MKRQIGYCKKKCPKYPKCSKICPTIERELKRVEQGDHRYRKHRKAPKIVYEHELKRNPKHAFTNMTQSNDYNDD